MSTRNRTSVLAVAVALVVAFIYPASADQQLTKKWFPGHYIGSKGEIKSGEFAGSLIVQNARNLMAANPGFTGFRVHYPWRDLEPAFGVYDFSQVVADLNWAHSIGKKLHIYIMERNYGVSSDPPPDDVYQLPAYMRTDPIYEGGMYCADYIGDADTRTTTCYPKIWLVPVAERYAALVTAAGLVLDSHPALAAVSMEESTFINMPNQPTYDNAAHHSNLINMHRAFSDAFPNTPYLPLLNFKSGLSEAQVEEQMATLVGEKRIGMADPGPMVEDSSVFEKPYAEYWTRYKGVMPFMSEIQRNSYEFNSARSVYDFSIDTLGVHFMVWAPVEQKSTPYMAFFFDPDVLAVLNEENFRINTTPPSQLLADGAPILSPENLRVVLD